MLFRSGVLCVDADFRGSGVASALVDRCERIVADTWSDAAIYAEVEAGNRRALSFFESAGFMQVPDRGEQLVQVRQGHKVKAVPHLLLSKTLDSTKNEKLNEVSRFLP